MPRDVVVTPRRLRAAACAAATRARIIERAHAAARHAQRAPSLRRAGWSSTTSSREYRRALVAYRADRARLDAADERREPSSTVGAAVADVTVAAGLARASSAARGLGAGARDAGCGASPRCAPRSSACGRSSAAPSWCTTCSGSRRSIRSASEGVLTDEEQALLFRERGPDVAEVDVDRSRPRARRRSRRAARPGRARPARAPAPRRARRSRSSTARRVGRRARPGRLHQRGRRRSRPLRRRRVDRRAPTTTSRARSATCSSTRRRTSPRCSGACSPAAARPAR